MQPSTSAHLHFSGLAVFRCLRPPLSCDLDGIVGRCEPTPVCCWLMP